MGSPTKTHPGASLSLVPKPLSRGSLPVTSALQAPHCRGAASLILKGRAQLLAQS